MFYRRFTILVLLTVVLTLIGCQQNSLRQTEPEAVTVPLKQIPAQRLNYRFEADVPAPEDTAETVSQSEERNEAVQLKFDNDRPLQILDRTITSPNSERVLAVYRKLEDEPSEFRLDVFTPQGQLVRQITHEEMAVHFPDTIRWSPDSKNIAFVAMVRGQKKDFEEGAEKATPTPTPGKPEIVSTDDGTVDNTNTETNSESESKTEANTGGEAETSETPEPPKEVITFRTEQIYLADADGGTVKPLTQNEGLMYFYFAWSPDSTALAALATSITEWRIREARARNSKQVFIPMGRPRMVETNGRERLLDDYSTNVHPVWSPDSSKIAVGFNMQVRIYDAIGDRPTQAAIPLKNDLLLASKVYEEKQKEEGNDILAPEDSNTNTESGEKAEVTGPDNSNTETAPETKTTLPDARSLVTFNPIIDLVWLQEDLLYVQTGWVRIFLDATENTSSYLRWHRLVLSPQAIKIENAPTE